MITVETDSRGAIEIYKLKFPGGEWLVRVPPSENMAIPVATVKAHLRSADEILQLLLTVDALRREQADVVIDLIIPYLPYARQDRVSTRHESLSVKVMADLINSMYARSVTIYDCHSDVGTALIDSVHNVSQSDILEEVSNTVLDPISDYVLVSPDAGAMKKTYDIAKTFGVKEVVCATKHRDPLTGRIDSTSVPSGLTGKKLLVVDDIFDGGFTFLQLGEAIRKQNPASVDMFVTHGIFSKGFEDVKKFYDKIVTTNSFHPQANGSQRPDGVIDSQFFFITL